MNNIEKSILGSGESLWNSFSKGAHLDRGEIDGDCSWRDLSHASGGRSQFRRWGIAKR